MHIPATIAVSGHITMTFDSSTNCISAQTTPSIHCNKSRDSTENASRLLVGLMAYRSTDDENAEPWWCIGNRDQEMSAIHRRRKLLDRACRGPSTFRPQWAAPINSTPTFEPHFKHYIISYYSSAVLHSHYNVLTSAAIENCSVGLL